MNGVAVHDYCDKDCHLRKKAIWITKYSVKIIMEVNL